MHALEEKNQLSNEVQRMRKSLEDIGNQKVIGQKKMVDCCSLLGFDQKETFSTFLQCSHLRITNHFCIEKSTFFFFNIIANAETLSSIHTNFNHRER